MVRLQEINQNIETQPIQEPQIINCRINKGKLITKLDDGREVIIAIDLLTKWEILDKEVRPEQLKNPKLHSEGRYIYFPDIDDTLPARIISEGIFKSC